jgi:arylsulfatase A-like enzyme
VLIYLALFASCVLVEAQAEYMGIQQPRLQESLMKLFWGDILSQQTSLAGTYAQIGALIGFLSFACLSAFWSWRTKTPSWLVQCGLCCALVLLVHALFLMRSMATYPQLYADSAEGVSAALFPLAVDGLGLGGVNAIMIGLGLMLAFFPIALIARLPSFDIWGWYVGGLGLGTIMLVPFFFLASRPNPGDAHPERPNVLVIAVDSLRSDMLEDPEATPNIRAFTDRAIVFENAHTVIGRTMPSWVSILTGQYPHTHGIRHMFPGAAKRSQIQHSVAKLLQPKGYVTGVITDSAGEIFSRIDLGFDDVDAPSFTLKSNVRLAGLKPHVHLFPYLVDIDRGEGTPILNAHEALSDPDWLTDRAKSWVDEHLYDPFFLTVFYSSGHFPFASRAPFHSRFTDENYRGRSRFRKATFASALSGEERAAEEAQIRGLYRGAVAASDAAIGDLLSHLESRGLLENTIVVITADHGENTYEHGLGVGHGDHLYGRAGHHVPLVIHRPGGVGGGRVVNKQVRTIDIAPTLFELLGLATPSNIDGVALLGREDDPTVVDRPVFAETGLWFFPAETQRLEGRQIRFFDGFASFRFEDETTTIYLDPAYEESVTMAKHRMLLQDGWKLIYLPTRDAVRWELYDMDADPGERHDVAGDPEAATRLKTMKETLLTWMLADPDSVRLGDYVVPSRPLGWNEREGAKL